MVEGEFEKPGESVAGIKLEPSLVVTRGEGRVVVSRPGLKLDLMGVWGVLGPVALVGAMVYLILQGQSNGNISSYFCPAIGIFFGLGCLAQLLVVDRVELSKAGVTAVKGFWFASKRRHIPVEGGGARVMVEASAHEMIEDDGPTHGTTLSVVLVMAGVRYAVRENCQLVDGLLLASEVEGFFGLGGERGSGLVPAEGLTREELKALAKRYLVAREPGQGVEDLCPRPVGLGESVQSHRVRSGHGSQWGWVSFRWLDGWRVVLELLRLVVVTGLVAVGTRALMSVFPVLVHLLLPMYLVIGWWAYRWAAGVCNRTMFKVWPDRLEMRHGPVWYPGGVTIKREKIKDVVVRRQQWPMSGAIAGQERVSLGLRLVDGTHVELEKERMTGEEMMDVARVLAGGLGANGWVRAQVEPAQGLGVHGREEAGVYVKEGAGVVQVLVKKRLGRSGVRLWVTGVASSLLVLVETMFALSSAMPVWMQGVTVGLGMCLGLGVFYGELVRQANYWRFELRKEEIVLDETPFKWIGGRRIKVGGLRSVTASNLPGGAGVDFLYEKRGEMDHVDLASDEQAGHVAKAIREHYGIQKSRSPKEERTEELVEQALAAERGEVWMGWVRMRLAKMTAQEAQKVRGMWVTSTRESLRMEVIKWRTDGMKDGLVQLAIAMVLGVVSVVSLLVVEKTSFTPWVVGGVTGFISLGFWAAVLEWALGRQSLEGNFEGIKIKSGFWFYPSVQRLDPAGVDRLELMADDPLGFWRLEAVMHDEERVVLEDVGTNEEQVRAVGGVLVWFYGWGERDKEEGTGDKAEGSEAGD